MPLRFADAQKKPRYLETGGAGATIRPWVWIAWLSLGPLISEGAMSFYVFLAVRGSGDQCYHLAS